MHCTVLKMCCSTLDKHFITWLRVQWRLCQFNWSIKHKSIGQAASDYNQQLHVKQMTQQTRLPLIKNISRPDETTNRFVRTGGNEHQLVHISSVYKLHSYISGSCVSLRYLVLRINYISLFVIIWTEECHNMNLRGCEMMIVAGSHQKNLN